MNEPFRIRQIAPTHGCPPSRKAALNHSSMKKPSTRPRTLAILVTLREGERGAHVGIKWPLATPKHLSYGSGAAARRCGLAERIGVVEHVSQFGAASLIPALASSTCST